MSYLLARPTSSRRMGLLGTVLAVHVVAALLLLAAKSVAPQLLETPLIVELLQPPTPPAKFLEAKRQPAARPQLPTPSPPRPALEATTSTAPAINAPVAVAAAPAPSEAPMTPARFDADYLNNPSPTYPPVSRRRGEEGRVVLHVQVSAQGGAEQIEIKSSSGSPRLDDAALSTVRLWRFVPARRGATPVHSWVLIPIVFRLEQ